MRNHFEYELFRYPPFNPWDRGFGPLCVPGWPNFGRPGCGPYGRPGFPGWPSHRRAHHRQRSPSLGPCEGDHTGRPTPPEHDHGGRHGHHRSPGYFEFPRRRCHERQVDLNEDHECGRRCHGYNMRGRSPNKLPLRRGHHHHWTGLGDCAPNQCRRDFFESFSLGPDHHRPHCGPRSGHKRSGPCNKPGERTPSRVRQDCPCRSTRPCCAGNEDIQVSNEPGARRKENETGDTVLVQRIIVETAPTRPKSV